jgi:hypothetical protein
LDHVMALPMASQTLGVPVFAHRFRAQAGHHEVAYLNRHGHVAVCAPGCAVGSA